ncbi:MAG: GTP pyrophosphokinase family protein [Lachnospiraceae bacterium]|nr:GTP pyrophosphokinase family protein [Lachnospiraceae bacterium]
MENRIERDGEVDSWKEAMLDYNSALKQIETKLDILNDEFQHIHRYNPIEHIKARIKTPESIVKKLRRYGLEFTLDNMEKAVNDIAGVRITCSFTSDIFRLADMIRDQKDIKVLSTKDYITSPKPSGYRSYHMIVSVPVYFSDRIKDVKVEIQIRTVAMDFWASLEHKINYKFEGNAPQHIKEELIECSEMIANLDAKMLSLNEEILEIEAQQKAEKAARK